MTQQQTGTGKSGRAINLSALTAPPRTAPDRTQGLPPPPPRPAAAAASPAPVVPAAAPPAVQERPAAAVAPVAPSPEAQLPAASAAPDDAKPAAKPAAKSRRRRARRNRAAPDSDGMAVYLPVTLRDQLRRYIGNNPGTTYTDVMYDALDDADDETLGALVSGDSARRSGGRFAGRKLRRLRHDEPQVQVTFRPSLEDIEVIDGLAEKHGAPNRSILVARAITKYLAGKGYAPENTG